MNVISTEPLPIFNYCENSEEEALKQLKNLANLPFAFKQIAALPGLHKGYGMPIESVVATKGAIIPNAVGVDIGCSVLAYKTELRTEKFDRAHWTKIRSEIIKRVPIGCGREREEAIGAEMPQIEESIPVIENMWNKAKRQMGTLGSGNHFIDILKDETGQIWVMVHSGSRNMGKKVCDYYNEKAKQLMAVYHSKVEPSWDLAFLPMGDNTTTYYIREMKFCMRYAKANRNKILKNCLEVMGVKYNPMLEIDSCHNYAREEVHFDDVVWVHRKGVIAAQKGELGVVAGSQGTSSFIVKGLGNQRTFMSCSHGAGRRMGRKEAMRELNVEEEIAILEKAGVIHGLKGTEELDEATSAYKNITEVIAAQKDCCEIVHELKPIVNIKG